MTNPLDSVPHAWQKLAALILFAEGTFLIIWLTHMVARAAARAGTTDRPRAGASILAGVFLAVWLGVAVIVGDGANFPLPAEVYRRPLSGLVALIPVAVVVAVLGCSRRWRAINAAAPSAGLIAIQVYRVGGALFLFPFLKYGALPGGFAWPAGVGDIITGVLAPLVAGAVARNPRKAFGWAVAWNLFGMADLVVAPVAAVLSHARVLEMYPLALVPLLFGPPLGLLLHIHSLHNLRATIGAAARPPLTGLRAATA
jgi:hypothetical protein